MGELIHLFGARAACQRCEKPLVVARERGESDHPAAVRFSKTTTGVCRGCAVTQWIREKWPIITGGQEITLDMVRHPHVQTQIDAVLSAAGSDAEPTPWTDVVENWGLPLHPAKQGKSKRRG